MKVFTGPRILPLEGPEPEAFAVDGEWVVASGPRAELRERYPGAEWVDLEGALVVPGFNDAHCHPSQAALARVRVDLSTAADREEVRAALRARAAVVPAGEWVVGQPLNEREVAGVDRDFLDTVSTEHPIVIIQYTFHRAVVNSRALEMLGYRAPADAPDGGELTVGADGRLDGWMFERAWLDPWLPGPQRASIAPGGEAAAQVAALREINAELHRVGITSYCDAIVTPLEQQMYVSALRAGQLTPRVSMLLWHSYFDPQAWPQEQPDAVHLQLAGVKMMLDGAFSGGTCLCRHPYPSATGADNGLQVLGDAGFAEKVRAVDAAGLRVAVHANGDLAIAKVLDVLESLPDRPSRPNHRIEHCSIVDDALIGRIKRAGVTPVPFGPFIALFGEAVRGFYGPERTEMACAHRSLLDAGVQVGGSSDFPIVPIDPLLALQSLVTRRTASGLVVGPGQRLDVLDALAVYTAGSAHATGESAIKGRLTPGQLADFVVLGADLTAVDPAEIASVPIRSTWVGGSCVWSAP
ncbi:amidohydrolase [Pseudonocardia nigra]|uniref:amidohydrolase n=1 Tax=Pseudonocardia nigra TaxID=1921578 RepID=UPI001C5F0AFF|nr:amidohydrolase [Pseudonocardia nigra]